MVLLRCDVSYGLLGTDAWKICCRPKGDGSSTRVKVPHHQFIPLSVLLYSRQPNHSSPFSPYLFTKAQRQRLIKMAISLPARSHTKGGTTKQLTMISNTHTHYRENMIYSRSLSNTHMRVVVETHVIYIHFQPQKVEPRSNIRPMGLIHVLPRTSSASH